MRRFFVRMLETSPHAADLALLVMRLWLGLVMSTQHGWGKWGKLDVFAAGLEAKGYPAPMAMAVLAALAESLGGLFVALGLLTRPAAFTMLFTMGVAAFAQHADDGWAKQELPLAYFAIGAALVVGGGGRYALDALLRRKLAPATPDSR